MVSTVLRRPQDSHLPGLCDSMLPPAPSSVYFVYGEGFRNKITEPLTEVLVTGVIGLLKGFEKLSKTLWSAAVFGWTTAVSCSLVPFSPCGMGGAAQRPPPALSLKGGQVKASLRTALSSLRAMPQKISGELRSRQLKAEVPLGRWRSSPESRAAGGAFHLIKGDCLHS